jgi:hypothetical protein
LKTGIAHMARVGCALPIECSDEWEDVLVDDTEHLRAGEVLEARPAEVCKGFAPFVLALGKDSPLNRLTERGSLTLLQLLHLIKALDKNQIGDLLDNLEWIGDPSRPKVVPDAIDLVAQFTG